MNDTTYLTQFTVAVKYDVWCHVAAEIYGPIKTISAAAHFLKRTYFINRRSVTLFIKKLYVSVGILKIITPITTYLQLIVKVLQLTHFQEDFSGFPPDLFAAPLLKVNTAGLEFQLRLIRHGIYVYVR